MKIACIDTGTNSIRLLLGEYDGSHFYNAVKHLEMTRLGKGVNETGMLDSARMQDSVNVIKRFYEEAKRFGADEIYIMATSAVRDSSNSESFSLMIKEETGLELEIISGSLEAEVGFTGVLCGCDTPDEKVLVIDIGGGSTELIVGDKDGIHFSQSLDIGAVRLTGALIRHDPVVPEEREAIFERVIRHAKRTVEEIRAFGVSKVIGIGGTATTIATINHHVKHYSREAVHQLGVSMSELKEINSRLEMMTVEKRKGIVGLEEKRADIIYAGGLILQTLLELLEINRFEVSDFDNLEGFVVYKNSKKNEK